MLTLFRKKNKVTWSCEYNGMRCTQLRYNGQHYILYTDTLMDTDGISNWYSYTYPCDSQGRFDSNEHALFLVKWQHKPDHRMYVQSVLDLGPSLS